MMKRKFWVAPSGRLHGLPMCSGGPGAHRMKTVTLTDEQWRSHLNKCKCARWSAVGA